MTNRFVRSSKFRHVFGTAYKKENCYDGIKVTKSPHESNMSSVNIKFIAVVLESQGGGTFLVAPLSKVGRFDINYSKVAGHKSNVLDIMWNPFNDNQIASASEDCTIKIWEIPDAGLTTDMTEPVRTITGHQKKVQYVCWHPCASDILLSSGADSAINIWNTLTGEKVTEMRHTNDLILSVSFNYNGSHIAYTSKDRKLRVVKARTGEIVSEGTCHDGNKPAKVVFCGKMNTLFTTGFSRMSDRQYGLWDPTDLSKPLIRENIDTSSGVLFPFFDDSSNMVYVVGKGDSTIKYFEVKEKEVFFLTMFQAKESHRGACVLPKRDMDYMKCETMRLYRLTNKGLVEPISMKVPRKSEMFQDDIFPPCFAGTPALSAEEWIGGTDRVPKLVKFNPQEPFGVTDTDGAEYEDIGTKSAQKVVSKPMSRPMPTTLEGFQKAYQELLDENAELKEQLARK